MRGKVQPSPFFVSVTIFVDKLFPDVNGAFSKVVVFLDLCRK